jgi:hypothetical protein
LALEELRLDLVKVQTVLILLLAHSLQQAVVEVDMKAVETGPLVGLVELQRFMAVVPALEHRDKEILEALAVAEEKMVREDHLLAELHTLIQLTVALMLLAAPMLMVAVHQHQLIPVVAVAEEVKQDPEVRAAQVELSYLIVETKEAQEEL